MAITRIRSCVSPNVDRLITWGFSLAFDHHGQGQFGGSWKRTRDDHSSYRTERQEVDLVGDAWHIDYNMNRPLKPTVSSSLSSAGQGGTDINQCLSPATSMG